MNRSIAVLVVVVTLAAAGTLAFYLNARPAPDTSRTSSPEDRPETALTARVESLVTGPRLTDLVDAEPLRQAVQRYYRQAGYEPIWLAARRSEQRRAALLEALRSLDRHGLDPSRYVSDALTQPLEDVGELSPEEQARLEVQLSLAWLQAARDLSTGRISPAQVDPRWVTQDDSLQLADDLAGAVRSGAVVERLETLVSAHPAYERLQQAFVTYRAIAEDGGWPRVPPTGAVERGDTSAAVPALQARLAATGDLAAADSGTVYTPPIAAAVAHFQRRHGLVADSVVGPQTRAALNRPVEARLRTMALNLERWRWLPQDLGERYLLVNLPAFRLHAYVQGRPALQMGVVVGEAYEDRHSPVFADQMSHVVFRPYWNIPHSIATDEILPKAREDTAYLADRGYEVVTAYGPEAEVLAASDRNLDRVAAEELRLRQQAGASNALGLVKFMFPNQFAVYLHDTPADHLFDRVERDFSHGCIRVERPVELADFVLADQPDWTPERIREAMHEGERQVQQLAEPLPVYILYWTAFVEEDGTVNFREDLYGLDADLAEAYPVDVEAATRPSS